MSLDFNVDPWYDDFDEAKNYHRILFKPGRAVQARELTQAQTILQDQITKFADNIFKQNSPVTGGQITTNFDCYYVKLEAIYNDVAIDLSQWYDAATGNGKLIRNDTILSAQFWADLRPLDKSMIVYAAPTDDFQFFIDQMKPTLTEQGL